MNSKGQMQTGWQKIKEKWYYFGNDGIMVAGTKKKISGKTYTFDKNGVCQDK
jgi:glucan-binding YG repeat protein